MRELGHNDPDRDCGPTNIFGPHSTRADCRDELRADAIDDLACEYMTDPEQVLIVLSEGLPVDPGTRMLARMVAEYNRAPTSALAFQIVGALTTALEAPIHAAAARDYEPNHYDGPEAA